MTEFDGQIEVTRSLGQIAYETYCKKRGWKSFKGDWLPQYKDQDAGLIEAWEAAGAEVCRVVECANSMVVEQSPEARASAFAS